MGTAGPLLARLRQETRASHARVDALPFFAALQAGEEPPARLSLPLLHALMLAEEIALRARRDPASLAGTLYVLEGAALGGLVLRPHVARAFGLAGPDGLAHLTGDRRRTRARWAAFTPALD